MKDIVDELREIQRMNTTLHGAQMAARAADEIERFRAERDEARRQLCEEWQYQGRFHVTKLGHRFKPFAKDWAEINGWDCFAVRSEP